MRVPYYIAIGLVVAGCARAPATEDLWIVDDLASSLEVGVAASEVRLALRVTNTSGGVLELTFPTAQRYDFMVETEDGRELWRWSADRAFAQVVTQARLEPGETWAMEATWVPDTGRGTYVATARLMTMEGSVEQRTPFELH
jgi:Leu/Phe-tRNA-protein transferase